MIEGYGRIELILVELRSGKKQVVVEPHLGSKKAFHQKYHTFEGVKHFRTLVSLPTYRTDNDFNRLRG